MIPRFEVEAACAQVIKELRGPVSKKNFATAVGIHRTHVSQMERLEKLPTLWTLLKIAKAGGVTGAELLSRIETRAAELHAAKQVFRVSREARV